MRQARRIKRPDTTRDPYRVSGPVDVSRGFNPIGKGDIEPSDREYDKRGHGRRPDGFFLVRENSNTIRVVRVI